MAHQPVRDRVVIENVLGGDAGNGIPQGWELALKDAALGAPIAGDQDVYVALMAILHQTDFKKRVLRITRADLCRVLDWAPNAKRYDRIGDALSRFRNVTYKGKNIFTDPKTGERFGAIEFGFVDAFGFSDRPPKRRQGADQPELPLSYVRLADEFLILCRRANLKLIDLDFYRALSRPETRWLYRFLDKNLYKRSEYRIGLAKLRRKQGLTSDLDPKFIKRDHLPRLDELQAKGFLRGYRFEKSRDPDDPWNLWVEKDPQFASRRVSRRANGIEAQNHMEPASNERIRTNSGHQEATGDNSPALLVSYFYSRFHGTSVGDASAGETVKAKELLARSAGDFDRARSCIDWIRTEAKRTQFEIQNFSGLFANRYPERANAALNEQKERTARVTARQELLELRDRYTEWYRRETRTRFDSLTSEAREQRVQEALVELRSDRTGRTFDVLPIKTQLQMAERRAERNVAVDLPSFEDWIESDRSSSLTRPAT